MITALSSLLIHSANQQLPALLSAFYTFLFCTVFYLFFAKFSFLKFSFIKLYWQEILLLNVTTAICWVFTFLSLKYLQPELYLFIYLCTIPITACVLRKSQLMKASILLICIILLTLSYHAKHLFLGAILAATGGVSGTFYSIYSQRLVKSFSTFDILSLRFYLTIIITLICCLYLHNFKELPLNNYFMCAGISLISVILPLTFFQFGIKFLPLTKALSFLPLAPLTCFFLNYFFGHSAINFWQILSIILISIAMLI